VPTLKPDLLTLVIGAPPTGMTVVVSVSAYWLTPCVGGFQADRERSAEVESNMDVLGWTAVVLPPCDPHPISSSVQADSVMAEKGRIMGMTARFPVVPRKSHDRGAREPWRPHDPRAGSGHQVTAPVQG
jgi:hypothetical protein